MTVYRVVSSDSHIVEPPDIWTERMPKKFGDRIPRLVHEEHGDWWYADGIRLLSISAGTDAGVRFERPGDYRKEAYFEQVRPGAYLPPEKLKDMDADGVYGEVIYPTLPLHFWRLADGELLSAIYHAYNDWAADFRTANPHRVKLSAAINLDGVHDGVRELERIADLGLATAMITVSPPDEYSYDNPIYDPFWAAAQDLDLPLSLHIGTNRRMPSEVHVDTRMPLRALSTDALRIDRSVLGAAFPCQHDLRRGVRALSEAKGHLGRARGGMGGPLYPDHGYGVHPRQQDRSQV